MGNEPDTCIGYEHALSQVAPASDQSGSGDDTALIVYTGGTTGKPRGVMLSHRNIVSNSLSTVPYLQLSSSTTQLHLGPFFHLGAGQRIFSVTHVGGTHVVLGRFSVDAVLQAIEREQVTATVLVPTMMHRLLCHPDLDAYDLGSLRYVSYGAAPMPPSLLRAFMARFEGCVLCQSYGQTECSPVATSLEHVDHLADGPFGSKVSTVGRAVPNVTITIVDANGAPLAPGTIGEITVTGPNVMKGYWNNPEATRQVLRNGRLHTGDLGFMDTDGFVTLVDRLKDMVISGGENVYSVEVERVLTQHSDVIAAAVIGLPDPDLGERVHAIVHHHPHHRLDADSIQTHCRAHLAGYKVPRSMDFTCSPLPLTAANKIDKRALKRLYMGESGGPT
ncbi:MAG TPA: fatty-acid--CoA ligase [Deltaproteobacteria bacterium]|nr:fatty-acid--CoA ligase [Deltaproteobacteria bacterium]HCP45029.1 fatty-acid--CoA ligase [Deltaproteobacteria bacterium]